MTISSSGGSDLVLSTPTTVSCMLHGTDCACDDNVCIIDHLRITPSSIFRPAQPTGMFTLSLIQESSGRIFDLNI